MAFRRAFSTTNKWRKFLQQSRGVHSEPVQPTIILGPNKKAFFNVGIFLLGGGIAGTMYYYVLQPNKFTGEILAQRNANYVEESEPLSKFNEKIDSYRWGSTAKPETEVQISKKEIILDEKTIKSHLSAIGFDEFDVDLILHEKKLKNQKLKISEILDELIEKYKKSGVKISKDGDNKKIEIKKQKTMIIEKINEDSGEYKFSNRVNKKHEESNLIFGKEEKEVKLITQLEVESTIVDKMKQEQTVHAIYTSLFALYAGLACTFAFKRRCRLRYDIFLSPIEKSRYYRYCRVFGATVGSVSKGAVYTVPWFALLCIASGRPFEPESYKYEKYYRDGYMELLPPAPVSLYPSSPNPLRINICNSKLNYLKDTDDVMECTTTLSTIQTERHPSFHPLEYPRNPLAPFGAVFFCPFAFAIAYPFTILPASCVGGFVLATLLMF